MIKAVIFDLDGTLLDRDNSLKNFIDIQYDRYITNLKHIPKLQFCNRFIELDSKGYVWKDKVYQQLTEELQITDLSWHELLTDYIDQFPLSCVPYPNLAETLHTLKTSKIKLAILSNGRTQFQKSNIEALGIAHYFDQIFISEEVGVKKPDSRIFKLALDKLQVQPYESVYVGDHPVNDIAAAQSCGIIGIWKVDHYWDKIKADYEIEDLKEVIDIINN